MLQVISLYHLGYDMLAENIIGLLKEPEIVLPSLLAITTQRFKRSLEQSSNQPEWIVTVAPQLYKRLQNTVSILLTIVTCLAQKPFALLFQTKKHFMLSIFLEQEPATSCHSLFYKS